MRKISVFLLVSSIAFGVAAQEIPKEPADFSIPEAPAFTVLGVSPQSVTRPGTPAAFATSLLRAVGENGKLENGIAIDVAPYLALKGSTFTLGEYQQNPGQRFAARTKLSFGTTQAEDAAKTQRVALGLHVTLFDLGDPRGDPKLIECYTAAMTALPTPAVQQNTVATDLAEAPFIKCRKESAERNWNRASGIIAGAPVWITSASEESTLESDGGGVWTSISWGFEPYRNSWFGKHAQLIGHWRKRFDEHVTKDKVTTDHDKDLWGARLRFGTSHLSGSLEFTTSTDETATTSSRTKRFLVGYEQVLSKNLSIQLTFGRESVQKDSDRAVVRGGFNWKFKTE